MCFHVPPGDADAAMLLVDPLPGSRKKTVWFALKRQPDDGGGY
jgi:hypothetical protein